ncbi:MAG: hypothetical protein WKF79_00475 [Nocardioides sp.]
MDYKQLRAMVERRLPAIDIRDPEALATAVHEACVEFATREGMKPEIEVDFTQPGAQVHIRPMNGWTVVFEAGPHDWGVDLSFFLLNRGARLCEPYYGFDLTFYRAEAAAA